MNKRTEQAVRHLRSALDGEVLDNCGNRSNNGLTAILRYADPNNGHSKDLIRIAQEVEKALDVLTRHRV